MELTYRRARILELAQILALAFDNVDRYEDFSRVDRAQALKGVRDRVQKRILNYTVAECEGRSVGCYYLHAAGGAAEVEDFFVFAPYRGRGVGTQMLRDCLARADGPLQLTVFAGNVRAVGFCIRMGFHICGEARAGLLRLRRF